ncbi:low choriolytic enzyme [Hydra vulgaris]|uniref:low choriolytic enzyme n=1 Tax=Hydra vulgaris TaxID=6087 RepID=UPI001F5FB626|nr:low choriolytic enzyme [Hydra vulgaris]
MKTLFFFCFVGHVASSWVKEMENNNLFEGDMVVTPGDVKSNGYASIIGGRWPNNIVPYELRRMSSSNHVYVLRAIDEYHKHTCLKFVKRTNEDAYLSFFPGGGCSSLVGYMRGRVNEVSLAGGCLQLGTVLHEIGHSIGLYHEQSRPDRDEHVNILWNNIASNMRYNFDKFDRNTINSLGFPYDYHSMMHYDETAFGNGRVTITTKDPSKQKIIGRAQGFSTMDIQQINAMYNCKGGGNPPTGPPTAPPTAGPTISPTVQCKVGQDLDERCVGWANTGYCKTTDRNYLEIMKRKCCKSCQDTCNDKDANCAKWAQSGECQKNPNWMLQNCSKSCFKCN